MCERGMYLEAVVVIFLSFLNLVNTLNFHVTVN